MKRLSFNAVKRWFEQPDWCNYPNALDSLGCWGLTFGYVSAQGKEYCINCECNKENASASVEFGKEGEG